MSLEQRLLGRIIGTAYAIDAPDEMMVEFGDFVPAPGVDLPAGMLIADLIDGIFLADDGRRVDIIAAIGHLPRREMGDG